MTDFKVTFPKLKSYSQYIPAGLTPKSKILNTIATDQPRAKEHCLSLQDRLSNLKYKYINKYCLLDSGALTISSIATSLPPPRGSSTPTKPYKTTSPNRAKCWTKKCCWT